MKNIAGEKVGRLTVIEKDGTVNKYNVKLWKCVCDCGAVVYKTPSELLRSKRTSRGTTCGKCRDRIDGTRWGALYQRTRYDSTTGYKGVSMMKNGKYRAYIFFKGKQISCGVHSNLEDAVKARQDAEDKYFKPLLEEFGK